MCPTLTILSEGVHVFVCVDVWVGGVCVGCVCGRGDIVITCNHWQWRIHTKTSNVLSGTHNQPWQSQFALHCMQRGVHSRSSQYWDLFVYPRLDRENYRNAPSYIVKAWVSISMCAVTSGITTGGGAECPLTLFTKKFLLTYQEKRGKDKRVLKMEKKIRKILKERVPKWKVLPGKSISSWKKIRKCDFALTEKYFSTVAGGSGCDDTDGDVGCVCVGRVWMFRFSR